MIELLGRLDNIIHVCVHTLNDVVYENTRPGVLPRLRDEEATPIK